MIAHSKVLVLTFKEDCPDIRIKKEIDICNELLQYGICVEVYDPHANKKEVQDDYEIKLVDSIGVNYDAVILVVSHKEFRDINLKINMKADKSVIFDNKSILDRSLLNARL